MVDGRRARVMKKRPAVQLSFPEPKMTVARRRAWVRNRLAGFEYRQAARVFKRKEAAKRRVAKNSQAAGEKGLLDDPLPEQLSIPSKWYRWID